MKLQSVLWWKAPEGQCHREVWATARAIELEQAGRRSMLKLAKTLYGDEARPYTYWAGGVQGLGVPVINPRREAKGSISYNLPRVAVDSLVARIAKNKPKASFVTSGGDWKQRRRAKRMDAFVFGTFQETGLYATGRKVFRDGTKSDLGALKGFISNGRICLERVMPDEVLVGAIDGKYGRPRSLFQRTWVSVEVAESWVDEWNQDKSVKEREVMKVEVRKSDPCLAQDASSRLKVLSELGSVVCVVEAWHLPSSEKAKDGRHVITLSGLTLVDEEWRCRRFPWAFYRFHERDEGFYGQGVPEILLPDQRAVSHICRRIQDSLDLMASPFFFVPNGSDIDIKQMTNEPGRIVRGNAPPQVVAPRAVPPELFQQYQTSVREALEKVGINQLSVAGQKPPGIDSAVGLREQQDIESGRFADVINAYDEFYVAVGQLVTDLARQAEADGIPLKALAREKKRTYAVNWAEAELDEDEYTLQVFASSSLPQSPAARKQYVRELFQDGLIDADRYRELLDMPDLEADASAVGAGRDYIEALIERFLDGDDDKGAEDAYEPPEKFMPLDFGIQRFQQAYLVARSQGAPIARLEMLLRWMDQAAEMMQPPAPPPMPPQPAVPAMPQPGPMGPPMAPPVPGIPGAPMGAPPMPPM